MCYVGQGLFHKRLVVGHIQNSDFMVCTPDYEVYPEQLDMSNVDLDAIRFCPRPCQLPVGIPAGSAYCFQDLSADRLAALLEEGAVLTDTERLARGLAAVGGIAPLPIAAVAAPLPPPPALVPAAPLLAPAVAAGAPAAVPPAAAQARPPRLEGQWARGGLNNDDRISII